MNEKYSRRKTVRRETDIRPGLIYRTLLRSYLWSPPVWVYIIELVVVAALAVLLLVYNKEGFSTLLAHLKGRP